MKRINSKQTQVKVVDDILLQVDYTIGFDAEIEKKVTLNFKLESIDNIGYDLWIQTKNELKKRNKRKSSK